MSEPMEERLAAAMARVQATQDAVTRAETELRQASVTVQSANRAVRVTVGAQGELRNLEFLDGRYRNMAASELSASVLEAMGQARAEMARQVVDTFAPITANLPDGRLAEGTDWERIFGTLLGEPAAQRKPSAMSRLRDEIHEDDEEPATGPLPGTGAGARTNGGR